MITAEQPAGAGDAGLYLVGDEEHVVLLAQVVAGFQISFVRYVNTCFPLYRFHQKGSNPVARLFQHCFKC